LLRYTQATRDTDAGPMSMIDGDGSKTDRTNNDDPFENRLSNSIYSESIVDSTRKISIKSNVQTDILWNVNNKNELFAK